MIHDNADLRGLLKLFFPKLQIEAVAKPSGQRVVYFCYFDPEPTDTIRKDWHAWNKVVMKVSSGIDPISIAYMQKEIEILRSLDSACYPKLLYHNIFSEHPVTEVRLLERLFITIEERIDALPLAVCRHDFDKESAVRKLLTKLVAALEPLWMHKQRLVHRDLKPDNILIKSNGDVVVIDLGILRETGTPGITHSLAPFGPLSAPYASPEQANNKKADITFKSDFFALGTIAYELLTGQNPFVGDGSLGFLQILENVRTLNPSPLEKACGASTGFSTIVASMMEKQPFKRPRTVEKLKQDLAGL